MAEEKRVNLKAKKFEAYIQKNNMNFFNKNEVHDEADTVVFQSNIKVEGQTIPMGIITDNTIYTIIRVQVGSFIVFKYVAAVDGSILLDCCLPSTNDSFDPEIVRVVLDVVVDHLNSEYKNIMKEAWE